MTADLVERGWSFDVVAVARHRRAHDRVRVGGADRDRDRPNHEDGEITECSFGFCPTQESWDMYVYYSSQTTPQSVIRQNETAAVEIAHLAGVTLADLTEADYSLI